MDSLLFFSHLLVELIKKLIEIGLLLNSFFLGIGHLGLCPAADSKAEEDLASEDRDQSYGVGIKFETSIDGSTIIFSLSLSQGEEVFWFGMRVIETVRVITTVMVTTTMMKADDSRIIMRLSHCSMMKANSFSAIVSLSHFTVMHINSRVAQNLTTFVYEALHLRRS